MTNFVNQSDLVLLLTTESNLVKAQSLADKLIGKKLAACVTFNNINSTYLWEGNVESSDEIQLLIKTSSEKIENLLNEINCLHSYQTPEIIYWKALASKEYIKWLYHTLDS